MSPELEGTQTAPDKYQVTARPAHGKQVTLYVQQDHFSERFFVKSKPDSESYISRHNNFEVAAKSANYRARRYLRAYSKPHGIKAKVSA
ncbi:hypothetical protein SEA_MUFASA8_43 [Arthrobacter phage Mufasa8]|uniref:Uncharacterized protein n=1 Tax=Arthrobacter phage Mufasa8 TaxID=2656526 RepID=A0A649VNH5_9CAUD|nr:hypothetical protein HYQ08_gp043 [Arthrobacter phage Mufasa8]QGJ93492.1 hypothetical protein SEA_MUFASA8_43 [Arthrobacter phage Mufasa8]